MKSGGSTMQDHGRNSEFYRIEPAVQARAGMSALRQRARHYRALAAGPMPWSLAQQLEALADECDDAARILAAPPRRAAS